jgi:hypothetical protein
MISDTLVWPCSWGGEFKEKGCQTLLSDYRLTCLIEFCLKALMARAWRLEDEGALQPCMLGVVGCMDLREFAARGIFGE